MPIRTFIAAILAFITIGCAAPSADRVRPAAAETASPSPQPTRGVPTSADRQIARPPEPTGAKPSNLNVNKPGGPRKAPSPK